MEGATLYRCIPEHWMYLPSWTRKALGWTTILIFTLTFLSVPLSLFLLVPYAWKAWPYLCTLHVALLVVSMLSPAREWPFARRVGQLWYDIYEFSCNLSEEKRKDFVKAGESNQFIIAMHPHGIIPLQAILWTSYCDQYLPGLYGFGAAADIVAYIPFLRNIMSMLTAGSATYQVLKDGLTKGECAAANSVGRRPKNLFILPGGVAEIFCSKPGRHAIVFKERRGLISLSIETGAQLLPTYVFGGTDFFNNLITDDNALSAMSRKFKMGLTFFWGRFGLPISFTPRVTLCIGDPLPIPKWSGEGEVPKELIDELHTQYLKSIVCLFEKYKEVAGYPDASLEIL